MRFGGKVNVGLLAVLGVLALPATAAASTTFTVNSETDAPLESGATTCESNDAAKDCTLLAAVQLAGTVSRENSGESVTVGVPEGKYENTLGSSGLIYIEEGSNVVIKGAGAGKTIIDGGEEDSVIQVGAEATLHLDGVTVQHGREDVGGGIYVSDFARLVVENSAIENNESGDGGGIYGAYFADIQVIDSTIKHNIARDHGYGGGIFNSPYGVTDVGGSTIEENSAAEGGGGGIFTLLLSEEAYEYCFEAKAAGHRDAHAAAHAARARAAIAAEEDEYTELEVSKSTIDHNTAGWGGGIDSEQAQDFCPIPFAKAASPAGPHASAHRARPSLVAPFQQEMAIDQSTIAYNTATTFPGEDEETEGGFGGGIYEEGYFYDPIVNTTIADNFATNDGGGLAVGYGSFDFVINDTVFDNTVEPEITGIQAKRRLDGGVAPSGSRAHATAVEDEGPGNNIATEEDAEVVLRNTIVAESGGQENCEGEVFGLYKSGYNLDYPSKSLGGETDTCGLEEEHNLRGVNPLLEEELKNNGGPTSTLALTAASPAIGFVPLKEDCEEPESGFGPAKRNPETGEVEKPVDQRGEKRPGLPGRECDIGAYEYQEPPATPAPVTTTTTPAAAASSVLPFKLAAPALCTSKRDITIHIQNVKQFGIVSAVVSIDGKHKRTLTGRHLRTAINLRGLPTGTFTIEIVARTNSGHKLTGKRVYHTCHGKLPGHSYLPL